MKQSYREQKANAKKRGIAWEFTYDTWMAWWGADIIHRGCRKGQLVQARKGDVGPYSPDNCIKITHGQNVSDAHKGKPKPAGHGAKVSAAQKGKPLSAEHCAKISAAKMGKKRGPYKKRQAAINQ